MSNDLIVAAVADGAGSARLSHIGADTAVSTLIRATLEATRIGQTTPLEILTSAVSQARKAVLETADELGVREKELATTLLSIVLGPAGGAALQIGDGAIVVNDGEDSWCWVFWPQHGEFANMTHFLTDDDALEVMASGALPGRITDISLMTDGLERLALDYGSRTAYSPFFAGLFRRLHKAEGDGSGYLSAELEEFLASDRVALRTDDDASLVIATRQHSTPGD